MALLYQIKQHAFVVLQVHLVAFLNGTKAATNNIQLLTEYPIQWGTTKWQMDAHCRFVLQKDYTPNTNPKGFRMKLTLEGHATGGIDAYWPFADSKCYKTTTADGKTEIHMPTQNNIWAWMGSYTWNFLIDFTNDSKYNYGKWPRGTCHGPYSLQAGTWGAWESYGACSSPCDGGTKTRTRTCSVSGDCSGSSTETISCNTSACDCGNPVAPANGTVQLSISGLTTYGATAVYACNIGYDLEGDRTIECQTSGVWSGVTYCAIKDCDRPPAPKNGSVYLAVPDVTTYRAVATQSCSDGYDLIGNETIECLASGNWSGTVICKIRDCQNPTNLADGSIILSSPGVTTYGASATNLCNQGFDLNGPEIIVCQASGRWTGPSLCQIKDCGSPIKPTDGSLDLAQPNTTIFGSTATYSCDEGYDLTGSEDTLCDASGSWNGSAICKIKDCGDPPGIKDGKTELSQPGGTTFGALATIRCSVGFDQIGDETIQCNALGSWNGSAICNIKDCGRPPVQSNASVELRVFNVTTYGAFANYSCHDGFDLIGNETIECKASGNWSDSPKCIMKDCGYPLSPMNGTVILISTNKTTYGSTAIQHCNKGFELSGNEIIHCQANSKWNYSAVCSIKDCKTPPQLSKGTTKLTVSNRTTYGATAVQSCDAGYDLFGNETIYCQADGRWSPSAKCSFKASLIAVSTIASLLGIGLTSATAYFLACRQKINPQCKVSPLSD